MVQLCDLHPKNAHNSTYCAIDLGRRKSPKSIICAGRAPLGGRKLGVRGSEWLFYDVSVVVSSSESILQEVRIALNNLNNNVESDMSKSLNSIVLEAVKTRCRSYGIA